jgi:uncharacterized RDD family membrane protein YckC
MVTPEGVDLGVQLASRGARLGAFIADIAILVVATMLLGWLVLTAMAAGNQESIETVLIVGLLGFFFLRNAWFIVWETLPGGATPGKRLVKIRVAVRNGGRLTADAVLARNVMRELELFMPLVLVGYNLGTTYRGAGATGALAAFAGLIWSLIFLMFPLFNRDRLRAGDIIAGTWVVEAPKPVLLPDLSNAGAASGERYRFTPEQVDAYGVKELHVLEAVMRRRDAKVMGEVARRIREKLAWAPVEHETDAEFLSAYYAALRRRLEQRLLFGHRRKDKFDKS